ncbi:hypothetical protein OIU84_029141 [Salix udensis]|uniref:Uncharacterized protein n=1 Tax=Salix udensis TaxID=889485 RepID=A0AAD6P6W3_9ROSI|nr:hypothetical protein OIU84_029141 [Salix udensis]
MVDHDVMVGEIAEVPDLCRIDLIYEAPLFSQLQNITNLSLIDVHDITNMSLIEVHDILANMSFIEVHDILAYGFELSWSEAACDYAKVNHLNLDNATIRDNYYCGRNSAPIRAAIDFLVNKILAELPKWRLNRYLGGVWIRYYSIGKPRLEFNIYKGED